MHDVWVEKYRPSKLADVVGQDEITERLSSYVKSGSLPHLLFAGPAGTGKTTSAIALAKELFEDNWRGNFHELNASDERGLNVVRTKIKEYARTAPIGEGSFKIIFLDEADSLTSEAQAALRRTMERYTLTCRFILSCNYSSKIIDPIQSRCAVFRFKAVSSDEMEKYIRKIAKSEKLNVTDQGIKALVYVAGGDLRRATNAFQVAASITNRIDEEAIYKSTGKASPETVRELIEQALEGNFTAARSSLDDLLINYGLSGEDLISQIHRTIYDLPINDRVKIEMIDRLGETEYRLVEGATPRIQIESLLAFYSIIGAQTNAMKGKEI